MKNNTSIIYNIWLVIGDLCGLTLAFTIAYVLRVTISHRALSANVHAYNYLTIFAALLPFYILIFALIGLYQSRIYERRFDELSRLIVGSFIGILFVISYSYIANIQLFPGRLVTLYAFALAFIFVFLFRTLSRAVRKELFGFGIGINNVLLVGDTSTTGRLIDSLANTKVSGYKVIGVVGGKQHHVAASTSYRIFQNFRDAIGHMMNYQLHTIIQTQLYSDQAENDAILTFAQEHHISYQFVPGNSDLFVGNIEVELFHSVPMITVHQTALVGWGRVVKRLMDIFIGGLMLVIASPFMLVIGLLIKLSDRGPVFFRHTRLSRYDSEVRIYKFRSNKMAYNGLEPEAAFTKMGKPELIKIYRAHGDQLADDPRVTKLGHFIRRTSIDELPQLINVVKGDISLVGPRALVAYELERFDKKNLILSVKSGLTGLAQISGVADLSFEERRKLDLFYVQNWSFRSDLIILIKTIRVVLFHKGTRS